MTFSNANRFFGSLIDVSLSLLSNGIRSQHVCDAFDSLHAGNVYSRDKDKCWPLPL